MFFLCGSWEYNHDAITSVNSVLMCTSHNIPWSHSRGPHERTHTFIMLCKCKLDTYILFQKLFGKYNCHPICVWMYSNQSPFIVNFWSWWKGDDLANHLKTTTHPTLCSNGRKSCPLFVIRKVILITYTYMPSLDGERERERETNVHGVYVNSSVAKVKAQWTILYYANAYM